MSQPSPLNPALERARALVASGDLAGAQVLLERTVELGRQRLGEDDPGVVTALRELAAVHQRADDPVAARRVLEEAYAAGQWRLGDSDPLLLQISYDLGLVAQELGNRHEARKAFGRVADHGPAALGAQHWAVRRARAYLDQGQNPSSVRVTTPLLPEPPIILLPPRASADPPRAAPPQDAMSLPASVIPDPATSPAEAEAVGPWSAPPQRDGRPTGASEHAPGPGSGERTRGSGPAVSAWPGDQLPAEAGKHDGTVLPPRLSDQPPTSVPQSPAPQHGDAVPRWPQDKTQVAMQPGPAPRPDAPVRSRTEGRPADDATHPWSGKPSQPLGMRGISLPGEIAAARQESATRRHDETPPQRGQRSGPAERQDGAMRPSPGGGTRPWGAALQPDAPARLWPGERPQAAPPDSADGPDAAARPLPEARSRAAVPPGTAGHPDAPARLWPGEQQQAAPPDSADGPDAVVRPWPEAPPGIDGRPDGGHRSWPTEQQQEAAWAGEQPDRWPGGGAPGRRTSDGMPAWPGVEPVRRADLLPDRGGRRAYRDGRMAMAVVVAAVVAAIVAVAALVFVLVDRAREPAVPAWEPGVSGMPAVGGIRWMSGTEVEEP